MNTDPYGFANLRQEDVEQIRHLEQQLSEKNGQEETLIAYESPGQHVSTSDK